MLVKLFKVVSVGHLLLTSQLNSVLMSIWKQMFQIIRPSSEVIQTVKSVEDPSPAACGANEKIKGEPLLFLAANVVIFFFSGSSNIC